MRYIYLLYLIFSGALMCRSQELQDLKLLLGPCVLLHKEACDANLKFNLYNSNYNETPKELRVLSADTGEGFDISLPFKVIIHGYGGGIDEIDPTPQIRTAAYLRREDMNILVVTYPTTTTVDVLCYPTSVANTWFVAYCTSRLLQLLEYLHTGFRIEDVHVIGFSLGAHIAAYTSDYLLGGTGRKFSRITALDPAKPLYKDVTGPSRNDLDQSNADFVDIIHTNAGYMGKQQPNGHVDFYLNGGVLQPACVGDPRQNLCSHLLAVTYFAESISSRKGFWGVQCNNLKEFDSGCGWNDTLPRTPMGDYAYPGATGIFLVKTSNTSPFALG